jgi:two-component system, chemotaxis family, sensor kinase CheA
VNDFIEQFQLESRELVEQATADLLALERRANDRDRLDSAFRAFHTLKGAAGIVDFAPMGRALHAAENVLAAVRGGIEAVTPQLISNCLTCLDQVIQWLDSMQADGQPPADAEAAADAIERLFSRLDQPKHATGQWVQSLLARYPEAATKAMTAIRFRPAADCFFRGEDPLALVSGLHGILALELVPTRPWPSLEEIDPFACQLDILLLASDSVEGAGIFLLQARDQVEIQPLRSAPPTTEAQSMLSPIGRALLEAQILLLAEPADEGAAGRLGSAGRVAINVLHHAGRTASAIELEQILAHCRAVGDAESLAAAIKVAMGDLPQPIVDELNPARAPSSAVRVLRVEAERIDALVRLTGELTVAKNAVGHSAAMAQHGAEVKVLTTLLMDQHALLDRLVGELQRAVLNVRVLPLRHVFQRFPRLVRETAAKLGKSVNLVIHGDDTEADKTIVEALADPLLHVVRNALDHGIEPSAERMALGKPAMASIALSASRQGEHVVVEVLDDGRGIDTTAVRRVASERGVVAPEALAAMTDEEANDLIFMPGLSTAATITGLSGRGVGMDAVRMIVGRLGGRVAVRSAPGQATTVKFVLPFSVMMTRVMTVEAGGQIFGIPLDAVVETVRIPRNSLVPVGQAQAFVLRDVTIPVVDLSRALGQSSDAAPRPEATIVVATMGGQLGGLEVERLGDRVDIILKPMDGLLANIPGIAGTSLLGDGRVLMVLDLPELLQ